MKKLYIITLLSLITLSAVNGQSNASFTYSMGFATGDLGSFIDKASFRGFGVDFRKMVDRQVGIGFGIAWNVFYQDLNYDSYIIDNQTISGKQYRYSNNIPMMVNGAYFLKPGETMNPYVGLGIGTMYTRRNTDMNLYTQKQEAWNFLLQPEIGIQRSVNPSTSLTISAKYLYGFQAGSQLDSPQSYFTLNVGFSFIEL